MSTVNVSEIEKRQVETGRGVWDPILYTVIEKHLENDKLLTFTLEPLGHEAIELIRPGQFNMLYVFGVGEIPISVSSLLSPHPTLVHTIQDVGPVSMALNSLEIGDTIGARGPFGTVWPIDQAQSKDIIIMAGGVGLCPLRPLIERILSQRDRFGEVNILYGARAPGNIIFHNDIISWQSDPTINFRITVDHAVSRWRGNVGVVTHLLEKARFNPENTQVYICGHEVMMRIGVYACLAAAVPGDNICISMERNMKCAVGFCGHCQLGPYFMCKDGAVFQYSKLKPYLNIAEL